MKKTAQSLNSFYSLGGMEILSLSQDEISGLWKIYLSTPEHYVISREFDRTKGMYGNAPESVVRKGLMDFSASLIGKQISLWNVIDLFIDRCFDDSVFNQYTSNAIWFSLDFPSYEEMEDILNTYSSRILWFDKETSELGHLVSDALYRNLNGGAKSKLIEGLVDSFKCEKIMSIFMNHDIVSEKLVMDREFPLEIPVFMGNFKDSDCFEFDSFKYVNRG